MLFNDEPKPIPPQALRALRRHKDTLCQLHKSFEYATEYARSLLLQPNHHYDGSYHCHTVRYQVAVDLGRSGWSTSHFRTLANSGLEILSEMDLLRCWKATPEEAIPAPGDSAGRVRFCNQPNEPMFLFSPDEYSCRNPGHLVVLWDVDQNLGLNHFSLACPKRLESIWKPVEAYWKLAIPHPANWIEPTSDFREADDHDFDLDQLGTDGADDPSKK